MICPKCGLDMFSRPIFVNGERISNFECKNKQCEDYIPDKPAAALEMPQQAAGEAT